MNDTSTELLFGLLILMIALSGFFSSSETGMMSLNRYRLKHLTRNGHKGASRASRLLKRTDQLIGVILIGNNFVNIFASSIATILALRFFGDAGIAIATMLLTFVILIFAEVTPKTLAAIYPEKIAFPAAYILTPLLKLLYPLVWLVNLITNGLLKLIGVDTNGEGGSDNLSREELRTLVNEAGALIPKKHQDMLVGILDLEKVTVNDILIPRNEVVGINIEDDISEIIEQIRSSQHTRLPVYKGDINNVIGILHLRNVSRVLAADTPNKALLMQECREPYFVPESTPLNTQLIHFQKEKRRIGVVVDEYGEILGIVTMEDILEEIVGEYTTSYAASSPDITPQDDDSYLIDGSATIRSINKSLHWNLPSNGPKTLNGLITEYLQSIPENNVCIKLEQYQIEVRQTKDNVIKTAQVRQTKQRAHKSR